MESFLRHIKLECKLLAEERKPNPLMSAWLQEGQGLPDQLEDMIQAILSSPELKERWDMWSENPGRSRGVYFDMYPLVKDIKRNFLGPESMFDLEFKYRPNISRPNVRGEYTGAGKGEWDKEKGLLNEADINMVCYADPNRCNFSRMQIALRSALAHELIHAFEDFNRYCQNTKSLGQALADRNYDFDNAPNNVLTYLAYVLDPAEQKAFIGQAVEDVYTAVRYLKKTGRLDRYENIRNADQILEFTEFFGSYLELRDFMENTQWNRLPGHKQIEFVAQYNKLVKGDETSPFSRKITTYNQFLKKLMHRWNTFDQELQKRVSQAFAKALYSETPKDPQLTGGGKISESIIYQAY